MRTLRREPRLLLILSVFAGSAAVLMPSAWADQPPPVRVADGTLSLDQAVAKVERQFKARVVRAETRQENGRTVYVLRLLNDSGRVWTVRVDAQSGSVR